MFENPQEKRLNISIDKMSRPHIKDKYYITYGIFYLLGILTFIPIYFVLTANRYWMFKFRYTSPSQPNIKPDDIGPPAERNILQTSFLSCYYLVSQLSLIIFVVLTAANSKKLPPPEKRISAALLCTLVFYTVNLIFCRIVTDNFQLAFFFLIMCIASFLGVCGAVIIVSLFEMVSKFPSEYYAAMLTGQALCGVVSAVVLIITLAFTTFPVTGGMVFFSIGIGLVLTTYIVYWYCKRNSQYFVYNVGNDQMTEVCHHIKFLPRIWLKAKSALKHTKMYMASLIIVFGTTAMVYPGVMTLIVSEKSTGRICKSWDELYFVPVVTYLVANLCDLSGRFLAAKIRKPEEKSIILALAIIRIVFIPLMLMCNAQPRKILPVLFGDISYILFTIVFSFSNGYLINLCVAIVPTRAQNEEEKGLITVMTVLSGIFSTTLCSLLSLLLVHVL